MPTDRQRIHLMTLWGKACKAQGWKPSDKAKRYQIYEEVLGQPKRFEDFTQQDFDRVKAKFMSLADNVQGTVETDHPELGERRRLLYVIQHDQSKLLKYFGHDPETYIQSVIKDKFKAVKGVSTVEDLSAIPPHPDRPSQLMQLVMTLNNRIEVMRKDADLTKDEMRFEAGLVKRTKRKQAADVQPDVKTDLAPITEDQPF